MEHRSKKLPLIIVAGIVIPSTAVVLTRDRDDPGLNGPMVQMLTTEGFTLVWEGAGEEPARVALRTAGGGGEWEVPVTPQEGRYEVVLEGLSPATVYEYRISLEGTEPREAGVLQGKVRTAPLPGGSFRFLVFGDSGDGRDIQYQLAARMPAYEPDLVIHTGDLIYPDGATEGYPRKFYAPYADLIRNAAVYPCLGNHDFDDTAGVPMLNAFVLPENGPESSVPERHYWFDFGDARFVCIDSDALFAELRDQVAPWLDAVLASAGDRWKFVYFHHPVCTNGKYTPSGKMLELIVPIFERYHVTATFSGHNHMYERSHPVLAGRVTTPDRGTVYITSGAGGNPLYDIRGEKPETLYLQDNSQHSFTVVDVTPQALSFRQIGLDGSTMDEFVIEKVPGPPESPGAAAG